MAVSNAGRSARNLSDEDEDILTFTDRDNPLEDKLVKNAMSKISTKKRKLTNVIQEKKERDGSKDNFER